MPALIERLHTTVRTLAASTAIALTAALGQPAPPAAAVQAAANGQFVGTFNIYGNVGHHGDAGSWIKDEADAVKDLTFGDSGRWLTLALQETCRNQGERFAKEMGMKSAFVAGNKTCDNGQPYGNTLLFHSATKTFTALLPNPDHKSEERAIICALVRTSGNPSTQVAACSTHLSVDSATNRQAQTTFIYDGWKPEGTYPLGAYGSVIIGGDFNALPDAPEMEVMYSGIEANGPRNAQFPYAYPTHDDGRKIDYLFTWDMRGPGTWSDTGIRPSSNSDHNLYYSKFTR